MHQLMAHVTEGVDRKVTQVAVEHLLKQLLSRKELASLMTAVTTNGGQPTGCVTTKRTVDGRIHISRGKKVFPTLSLHSCGAGPKFTTGTRSVATAGTRTVEWSRQFA